MTADLDHITDADRLRWARRSLDRQDAQIEELTAALDRKDAEIAALRDSIIKFQRANAAALAARDAQTGTRIAELEATLLQRDESPEPMHTWSND